MKTRRPRRPAGLLDLSLDLIQRTSITRDQAGPRIGTPEAVRDGLPMPAEAR